ncbi:MAG: hypothetical protein RID07_03890 [Lacipirellulaceae bacterium]
MLLLTTFAAVSCAALMKPDTYWAPLLTNLSVAAQLAAVVACIFAEKSTRAFAAGFAICNGFFLVAEFVPWVGKPVVRNMLPYVFWSRDSPLLVGEFYSKRAFMGLLVSGFVYGYGGAVLARRLYQRRSDS